jgi:hypothetical protein
MICSADVDRYGDWQNSAPRQWQVLSLVTFFGPAKKVTRLPAGTGEVDFGLLSMAEKTADRIPHYA